MNCHFAVCRIFRWFETRKQKTGNTRKCLYKDDFLSYRQITCTCFMVQVLNLTHALQRKVWEMKLTRAIMALQQNSSFMVLGTKLATARSKFLNGNVRDNADKYVRPKNVIRPKAVIHRYSHWRMYRVSDLISVIAIMSKKTWHNLV